eukprot:TRINITY_DN7167_c0_g1_i1.p1 TRINITY_DN7167_c0_g1~~TRINITY_DN7167_c0_g1_i1.p1  ORF type:complete len:418 (+),score=93.11 TRINITY_DN7167_c0_g1_i1:34-1287(+)
MSRRVALVVAVVTIGTIFVQLLGVLTPKETKVEVASDRCNATRCSKTAYVSGMNAKKILTADGWREVRSPGPATLIWQRSNLGYRIDPSTQIMNSLPNVFAAADKAYLCKNVVEYEAANGMATSPLPFTLPLITVEDMNALTRNASSMDGLWIVKKTSESMGRGIVIVEHMPTWVRTREFSEIAVDIKRGQRYVCQKYITNPLLLEGRKSEVRLYWVILSLDPLVAAVFGQGQVRLNSMQYVNGSFTDPRIHLTNAHQQAGHPEFDELLKSGKLKWTLAKWKEYLAATHQKDDADRLVARMKWSLVRVINATSDKMKQRSGEAAGDTTGLFEFLGADFIVTADMEVRLTEVQQGPGLSHTEAVKTKIIHGAVGGAVRMAYDLQWLRRTRQSLGDLKLQPGYEFLVNEAVSPPYYFSP